MHIRTPSGKRRLLAHDLRDVIERLQPIAEEHGDAVYLKALCPVDQFETGAARQRRIFHESGDWRELVAEMTRHWAEGL
jgi:gamma-glutamyl:cysteine ligase YbdK (ATP-grasp superfamily)